jgi:hypothetical protein
MTPVTRSAYLVLSSCAITLVMSAALLAAPARPETVSSARVPAFGLQEVRMAPDGRVVVAWNLLAYEIAFAEDEFRTFRGQRALAMMNLAMHDALNTIDPIYERYAYRGDRVSADAETAAAVAAAAVLRAEYPGAAERLDEALAGQLASPADKEARTAAVAAAVGRAAAAAILSARTGDGWDAPGTYAFSTGAGRYATTPDWNGFVLQPGFGDARPFAGAVPGELRPEPPPALTSGDYARAFEEVRSRGAAASTTRTGDQAAYAVWWMEFAEGSVNRLARRLVQERDMELWSAARLFAQLHMSLYDAYVMTWASKYEYDHWRPYTAIRAAAGDGNPETEADPEWVPMLPAPPFPEYVSAHAAGCAAAFTVLAEAFGDDTPFTMTTITAPAGMPERSFTAFSAAAAECADSRVQLGWHFRYSTDAGLLLGERVAGHVLRTSLSRR